MKIYYLLIIWLLLTVNTGVHAQTENVVISDSRANIVKLNTLPLIIGSINVSYERRLSSYTAGAITATAYPKSLALFEKDTSSTYALAADFKFYLKKESLNGFYFGPYLKYRLRKINAKEGWSTGAPFYLYKPDREVELWAGYGAGVNFGIQKIFPKGFTLDSFVGLGYYFHQDLINETKYTKEQIENRKPMKYDFRLGLLLGYAF